MTNDGSDASRSGPAQGDRTIQAGAVRRALGVLLVTGLAGCQTLGGNGVPHDLYELMSDADVELAVETMQLALETGSDGAVGRWSNPETGNSGAVRPVRTYQTEGGYFCRDFEELLNVEGNVARYDNHACRADDGVWRFYDD